MAGSGGPTHEPGPGQAPISCARARARRRHRRPEPPRRHGRPRHLRRHRRGPVALAAAVGLVAALTGAGGAAGRAGADLAPADPVAAPQVVPVPAGAGGAADRAGAGATAGGQAGAGDVVPEPSAGCAPGPGASGSGASGTGAGAAGPVEPGVSNEVLAFAGAQRSYIREVPTAHDGRHPLPVVVDLHGWGGPALVMADYTRLGRLGEARGFVTLTPQGAGDPPAWNAALDSPDVLFVGALLDEAEATLCLDTRRVYVVGASNGAMLASTLACLGGGRIAAVAAVAGASPVLATRGAPAARRCRPTSPVPIVAVHGTADPIIRFRGGFGPGVAALPGPDGVALGERQRPTDLSIPDVLGVWARRQGCDEGPGRPRPVAADVRLLAWTCPAGAGVRLYVVQGGGHGWPGGNVGSGWAPLAEATAGTARTSRVSANKLIWAFFVDHPLATPPS